MFWLRQRYAKMRMPAFLRGDLPLRARRYVARQVDADPLSYADYTQERQLADELARRLPTHGRPNQATLNRVWSRIQADLAHQPAADARAASVRLPRFRLRYSLVMLVMVVALLLPLMLDNHMVSAAVPSPAAPEQAHLTPTAHRATVAAQPTIVALVELTEPGRDRWHKLPANTPAP